MMKEFCEIGFTEDKEFIIIPELSILLLVQAIRKLKGNRLVTVPLEELMPQDFIQYVAKVINTNRKQKKFQYNYIEDDTIGTQGVLYIVSRQLARLTVDNVRCFTEVFLDESKDRSYFILQVTPEVQKIVCKDRKEIVISKYN